MPLLEETDYLPTEKYARSKELRCHAQNIAHRYGLYQRTLFQTEVTGLVWNETRSTWALHTNRGDSLRARFVISASGPMHKPKLPGVKGLTTFQGHSFHSSRWEYGYTGGDSNGNLHKLADKRVGIIGTGATAVQIVPRLGESTKELYVFQRTPSSIDARNNKLTNQNWAKSLGKGWQKKRMTNFNNILSGEHEDEDLVADGWTDIFSTIALKAHANDGGNTDWAMVEEKRQLRDFQKMEQVRARVESIVKDPATAEKLKPFYNQLCKRPCFHDEYLQTFNRPNVTLVDTDGRGVEAITESGVVANGHEYPLDCLIYATGFELVTDFTQRTGYDLIGEKGVKLSEKWRDGPSTFHGYAARGFPNHFFIQVIQSVLTPNIIHGTGELVEQFAYIICEAKKRGVKSFQPSQAAEDAWVQDIMDGNQYKAAYYKECTPGYYNNEGKLDPKAGKSASYASPVKYIELLRDWREKGDLRGLELNLEDGEI
jgi:cation diffusion facilitator CzcD-associated flavoprotein CzcO